MPSEWATRRARSTASGEQQLRSPSVAWSAHSFSVTATTSAPRSRSSSAATAESTPPLSATSTRSAAARRRGEQLARARERRKGAVQGVRGELGRVPVGRGEAAQLLADQIGADRGRLQHRAAFNQLGDRRRRGPAGGAALGVLADAGDRGAVALERDPNQVSAGSASGRARDRARAGRAAARVVRQVVLDRLSGHRHKSRSTGRLSRWAPACRCRPCLETRLNRWVSTRRNHGGRPRRSTPKHMVLGFIGTVREQARTLREV